MKEHLKKHKQKEQSKKKEYFVLADIELGFFRGKKTDTRGISYCKKLCEARKFTTREEALQEQIALSEKYPMESLSLAIMHSTDDKALFLEKLLKEG